jgi:hypothetical protein
MSAGPMITAFFRWYGRGTGPGGRRLGEVGGGMSEGDPGGTRLPCPCAARHATAVRTRVLQALAVAGLTALAVLYVSGPVQAQPTAGSVSLPPGHGGGSAMERITLIAIAVLAVGAFAVLQVIARSQRRRWSAFADWRTWPPGFDPWAGRGDPVTGQHEGSAYRPGYGFLPGHGRGSGVVPEARRGTSLGDPPCLRYLCRDVANVWKGAS